MDEIRPHVVCVPLPAQGHINPMLKLAKLLHLSGFYITFVHTQFNFDRLVKSNGPDSLKGLPDFKFETISDGLPPTNQRGILDLPDLCITMPVNGLRSFRDLIAKLVSSADLPPLTCIVSDGVMGFTLKVAQEFNIPEFMLFTPSGCGMLGYLNFEELVTRGFFPLKDEKNLSDGYLETEVDWIPAMRGARLKDLPTFFRTTNSSDIMFNYNKESVNNAMKAKGVILNTFEDLEAEVLEAIRTKYPNLYPIGPLAMLYKQFSNSNNQLESIDLNLWKEDVECLRWLDKRDQGSVVYVNFGSLVIMTSKQLREFAWGLANSKYHFLWVIRPNLVDNGAEIISNDEFVNEIDQRGLILEWCPQEKVLGHPSVGGFLTHCGWNSVLESICEGVPMACWPFFAEQQTNCFYAYKKWGIGMEIESDVDREQVEGLVRELMGGEKGEKMRNKAGEWKQKAEAATSLGGSSYNNYNSLVLLLKEVNKSLGHELVE
ncbi:7-deoxyloganetin glucosyltransferase-like [Gastrolobium bilobum]|uniref:7-deoxyloganetin glucosyltransferase-like n=1 Tax=Gastrolobium bilobum TaxID=150636 RepID=UPI002AB0019E|nr:7-deoxyloganetin glucosyltransferase-like [Gastrolobium bilobum]